jgi:hypothetical protein
LPSVAVGSAGSLLRDRAGLPFDTVYVLITTFHRIL